VRVAGIDGTKGGWVAIVLEDGRFAGDRLLPVETQFDELSDALILAIDVPIGFGPRMADGAARTFLAGSASTVFTIPPRHVFEEPFGAGRRITAQAHALGPQIRH
jgi:predicted RNase H-like nuclease